MKRHLPQQPHDSGRPSVASTDFSELPSVLTSREAANVLRVGIREVRALVDSGPPSWDDAKFALKGDVALDVTLHY